MTRSSRAALALTALLAGAAALHGQSTVLPPKPDTSDWIREGTNCTVITSRRLSLDQEQRRAVFEENVLVVDGDLTLTADKMTVFMSPSNTVETIQAEGRIHATQGDRVAIARRADYDGRAGKIVLTGDPKLQQGRDILKGDTITFWTAHRRVVCEPNAVMVIYSEHGGSRDSLLGATPDE
jgi:lipopolysaccharide export system protein LptA